MRGERTRICPACGNPFSRKGDDKWTKTCSRKCAGALTRGRFAERFWSHVDKSGGPDACWPWMLSLDSGGYGHVGRDGKLVKAHRVAYELVNGPISDGLDGLHSCDNPPCCNPSHIFPGTHGDNMRDAHQKGRRDNAGERNANSVLTEAHVREIRAAYERGTVSQQSLADQYGVHQTVVSKIIRRKLWPNVE